MPDMMIGPIFGYHSAGVAVIFIHREDFSTCRYERGYSQSCSANSLLRGAGWPSGLGS